MNQVVDAVSKVPAVHVRSGNALNTVGDTDVFDGVVYMNRSMLLAVMPLPAVVWAPIKLWKHL